MEQDRECDSASKRDAGEGDWADTAGLMIIKHDRKRREASLLQGSSNELDGAEEQRKMGVGQVAGGESPKGKREGRKVKNVKTGSSRIHWQGWQ